MHRKGWLASFGIMFICLVMFSLVASPLSAQSFGAVSGTVTDATGAVVAGASVTLINVGTADTRTAQTSASGEYRFVNLTPATYKLDVQAKAFKRFEQQSLMVEVDSTLRVDAALQVGASTETVEVTTQPPLLQTETGSVSSEVEGKVVQEMPLNGRNTMNLVALVPGVVPGANTSGSAPLNAGNHTTVTGFDNYSIGGGQNGYASHYIDGAPDNVLGQNTVGLIPTQDATQEFRVATNAVSAEYGRFGGGIVEIATKSGGNRFHGSVYEYLRNTVLNSNYFFNKASSPIVPRAKWNQNQYGVSLTGPIVKDKAFFMFTWEDYSLRTAAPVNTNVPTVAQLSGVFNTKITDPTGKCAIQANTPAVGQYTVPQSCFDVAGKALLGYFPTTGSNHTPTPTANYNYTNSPVVGDDAHQYNGRVDYNLSGKQRIFGRYTYWGFNDIAQNEFTNAPTPPALSSTYGATHLFTQSAVLGDTYTVNSTTIADLRVSYLRQTLNNDNSKVYNSTNEAQFGPGFAALAPYMTFKAQPNLGYAGGIDALYGVTAAGATQLDRYGLYTINGSLTKIVGSHSLKFGAEGRLGLFNSVANYPQYAGLATYSATNGVGLATSGIGDEIAALELGVFTQDQIYTVIPTTTFNYSYAFYGTDTWKATRNLTVTLGLRYELPGGMEEKKDRSTVLLPNAVDTTTGYKGMVVPVNSSLWSSRSVETNQYHLFSPRVSFAQRIGGATVLRGGYGLIYLPPDLSGGVLAPYASPAVAAATTNVNQSGVVPTYYQANPFPFTIPNQSPILQPYGRSYVTKDSLNQVVTGAVPSTKYPYISQYNLALSHQWKGGWLTEVTGVGAKGTHLPVNANNGTPPASVFGLDEVPTGDYDVNGIATVGPNAGQLITNKLPCAAIGGQIVTIARCLSPYPQFLDVQDWTHYTASSIYDALYVTLQKRFGSGGTLNANYVWFKSLDDVGGYQDFYNLRSARGLSGFDVPQRAVVSYVLDLPFGKGQRWAHFSGVGGALVSGWAVNGISSFQSGSALSFTSSTGNKISQTNFVGTYAGGTPAGATLRATLTPGCTLKTSGSIYQKFATQTYFNASCVSNPGSFVFGNAPRASGDARAPGVDNFDFSVLKATKIKEFGNLEFRMEAFNLFNRMQFGAPSAAVGNKNYNHITAQANNPRLIQASLRLKF